MVWMRSPSKNMCSVRQRPMPSAPKLRAVFASSGVSALARTFILRAASAHFMSSVNSGVGAAGTVGTASSKTWPVEPSIVRMSPFFFVTVSTTLPASP